MNLTPAADDPRLAHDHHLLPATVHQVWEGPAAGSRVLLVQPAGGLHTRVLLDRGLDVGAAWYAGYPIAWSSPSGEHRAGLADRDEGWHRGWAGGLVTTCGLRHIGPPGGGYGRHGMYSECAADEVSVRRVILDDRAAVEVTGTVRETDGLDRGLTLRRTLRWFLGTGTLQLRDEVANEIARTVRAPILYHLDFGYPFLTAASTTSFARLRSDPGYTAQMGDPAPIPDEVVAHRAEPGADRVAATVTSPELALRMNVRWSAGELDRAYTWRRREPGCYVHGIEPTNAALIATEEDPWPVLEPGQKRRTGVDLTVGPDHPRQDEDHDG